MPVIEWYAGITRQFFCGYRHTLLLLIGTENSLQ